MTQTPVDPATSPVSPALSAAEEALATSTDAASLAHSVTRSAQIEADLDVNPDRYRMLTGVRPTGNMHLGHYFGTMHAWKPIQDRGVDTWILIADYQVITDRDGVGPIRERVLSLVADTLAVGVDPDRSTIFTHSAVPAANQLMLPFLSLVTEAELHRNPTVKAELEATNGRAMSGLLLTYPVHQAADILFCQANLVPVGKDQLPHLEQARLIAQRFDKRYGRAVKKHPVFRRPEALLSEAPLLLGLDGEKMSKSRGNTIALRMSADETAKVLRKAKTAGRGPSRGSRPRRSTSSSPRSARAGPSSRLTKGSCSACSMRAMSGRTPWRMRRWRPCAPPWAWITEPVLRPPGSVHERHRSARSGTRGARFTRIAESAAVGDSRSPASYKHLVLAILVIFIVVGARRPGPASGAARRQGSEEGDARTGRAASSPGVARQAEAMAGHAVRR